MTSTYQVAKKVIDALRTDSTLSAYCTDTLSYSLGLDSENPPVNSKLPLVVVMPVSKEIVTNQHVVHSLSVGVAVTDNSIGTTDYTKYEGFETIADLEAEIYAAIQRFFDESSSDHSLSLGASQSVSYECFFPQYHSVRNITVAELFSGFDS